MKINEIMEFENKIFYCGEYELYVKVVNNNGLEVISSRYLDEFTDQSPLLEQLHSLNEILNMDFVEVSAYTINDILNISNVGKIYNIIGYGNQVYIDSNDSIPIVQMVDDDAFLDEIYFLRTILDMRFVEVV